MMYTASFFDISVAAAQELLSLLPAANRPIEICRVRLNQVGTADMLAGEEESLAVTIVRGHTTAPSGGATVTPVARDVNAASSGVTARRNDTTLATAGAPLNWQDMSFNVQIGLDEFIPPEYRVRTQNTSWVTVRLRTAPADAITMSGSVWFRTV